MSMKVDNSRYLAMIKNRPSLSILPAANTQVLAQRAGTIGISLIFFEGIMSLFLYRQMQELYGPQLYNTRKAFAFKADPYSMAVSCYHRLNPYKQHGY